MPSSLKFKTDEQPATGKFRSQLLLAIEQGVDQDIIVQLIEDGESIHVQDHWGNAPLHYAALWGADRVAVKLLEQKADPHAKTAGAAEYNGLRLPIELAASFGREDCVLALLRSQPWESHELHEALFAASASGSVALDELLDCARFDNVAVCKALDCAVKHNRIAALDKLLHHKNVLTEDLTDKMVATIQGDMEESRGAPEDGLQPGKTIGQMMLFVSLKYEYNELASHLIDLGVDPGLGQLNKSELHVNGRNARQIPFGLALTRGQYASATRMLPAGFLTAPGTALYASLCAAQAARMEQKRVQVQDPLKARMLAKQALAAELMGLQLLLTLPEVRQLDLLRSTEGEKYLRFAASLNSTSVLSQPMVQTMMNDRWRGALYVVIAEGRGISQWGDNVQVSLSVRIRLALLMLVVVLPANMLAILFVAVFPHTEFLILKLLRSFGEQGEHWALLQDAGYSPTFSMWYDEFWLFGEYS